MKYLVNRGNQQFGPYSIEELRQYVIEGRVLSSDLAWAEGMAGWQTVAEVLKMPPAPPGFAQGPAGMPRPSNYLVPAIFVTLCCCLPFGVVSIVYAAQVDSKFDAGDYAGAVRTSETAKNWFIAALVCGLLFGIGYFVLTLIGAASSDMHHP